MNKIVFFIISVLSTLILPFTLSYIFISYVKTQEENKKNCQCSNNIRTKYIKFYGYTLLILAICGLLVMMLRLKSMNSTIKILSLLNSLIGVYVLYSYSDIISSDDCSCSDSWKKVFIKYYSFIMIGILGMTFLSLLLIFIFHISTGNEKTIKELQNILKGC